MAKLSVEQALAKAKSHTKKGEVVEAQALYTVVLKAFPNNKKAQQGLVFAGKTTQSTAIQSSTQRTINQLANLFNQGQLSLVAKQAEALSKYYPDNFVIWSYLGGAYLGLGKAGKAVKAFNRVTGLNPNYPEGHNNLGAALQTLGSYEESLKSFDNAVSLKPDYSEAYYNIGISYKELDQLDLAIIAYNKSLALNPNNWETYGNLGLAFKEKGEWVEAVAAYKTALAINPNAPELISNMGNALKDQGKLEEAIEAYNKALAIKPDYAEAYNNMGITLKDQGKLEEAIETYSKALAIKSDYTDAYYNMGIVLEDQGKLEEAIGAYNKALSLKPDYAEAHRNLSNITKYKPNNSQISEVGALLKHPDLNNSDRCNLHYTYAKMKEDLGDLSAAFDNYVAGGELRQKLLAYDLTQDQHLFAKIKNTAPQFNDAVLHISNEAAKHTPIFILGMPRSGTTLIEQIVSSHSEVTGAGELNYVSQFGASLTQGITATNAETISAFRKSYLTEITKMADGRGFVTDKMPHNFKFIALICAAFPEAKIIHVQREAEATCWSNFKHYFASKDLGYCCNLADTASYYGLYTDLMHLWQKNYGNRIYNLDYDKLTEEQKPETRRLIEHLGLNWEDACLAPQNNKRSVKTASQQQVRQKVYKGSSQAWRKYEPFLSGVFDELKSTSISLSYT